jgi:putative membrane protein
LAAVKDILIRFLIRWTANTLGLWIAANVITDISYGDEIFVLLVASFILSLVNALLKPLLVMLSLPFIVLSLGLFTAVINGVLVWLVGVIYGSFNTGSFTSAVLAGLIVGLVNYLVTIVLEKE